jgi:hypothetical protein
VTTLSAYLNNPRAFPWGPQPNHSCKVPLSCGKLAGCREWGMDIFGVILQGPGLSTETMANSAMAWCGRWPTLISVLWVAFGGTSQGHPDCSSHNRV